jgi:hypothetical protein
MSEHRDTSLEDRALAIVAALPESVIDALALRLAQRREPLGVDQRHGDDEARARLLAYLTEHGPASQRQVRSAAGVAGWKADALIRDLEGEGVIENAGTGRARAWVTCANGSGPTACVRPGDTRDTRSDAAVNGSGDRADAMSAEFIDGPCPDPTSCRYRGRHATGPWSCAHNHPREPAS